MAIPPCTCGKAKVGRYRVEEDCRQCWHQMNGTRLGLQIMTGVLVPVQYRRGVQGGKQQREGVDLVKCPDCKGNVMVKVPRT